MKRRQHRRKERRQIMQEMLTLSTWEQFVILAAIAVLTKLESKITNPVEKAAIEGAIAFLKRLVSSGVKLEE
jgi:hypothetical protein